MSSPEDAQALLALGGEMAVTLDGSVLGGGHTFVLELNVTTHFGVTSAVVRHTVVRQLDAQCRAERLARRARLALQ